MRVIRPQPGPQEAFLASSADIVIYGGAAGGGKTWALLMEPTRHLRVKRFGSVVFRRQYTQITSEGGLWDTATELFPHLGGRPFKTPRLGYRWRSTARVTFSHLNRETDTLAWQGSQIPLIEFDELTHFTESQFWYLLSRNRSTCGVHPYVRATCNPDADSWVAELIAWWIDQDPSSPAYGLPIAARAGKIRWFVRVDGALRWGDSPDIALEYGMERSDAKSLTFIPASVYDNQELLRKDPSYLANLKALDRVARGRLLDGNWKIRPEAGMYFRRSEVTMVTGAPPGTRWIRAWDFAATEPNETNKDPDWSIGVKLGHTPAGRWIVGHVRRARVRSGEVRTMVEAVAKVDGPACAIAIPIDPGSAGKTVADDYVKALQGYTVIKCPITGDKVTLAGPVATQWEHGNVDVMTDSTWNNPFFGILEAFPTKGVHDDDVDALSLGFYAHTHDFRPTERTSAQVRL